MGSPMFASAPTVDGFWYAVRICSNGQIAGIIPGIFNSKVAADLNAKRNLGLRN